MRKRFLKPEEYMPFAPEHVGIVRVNHQSDYCVGDSVSMLVERKDDGSVAAHCFRCDSGGYSLPRRRYRSPTEVRKESANRAKRIEGNVIVGGIELPNDTTGEYDNFGDSARAWLTKAGLTKEVIERENFLWSDDTEALYIPVRQETDLVGFVKRRFDGEDRYRTLKLDSGNFFGYYRAFDKPTSTVVIVEDVLSGLRVSEFFDTLVALGTNLLPAAISKIMENGYTEVVIFLDADNPTVRRETRRMASKLPFVPVRFIETGEDPKNYPPEQLRTLLVTVTSNSN